MNNQDREAIEDLFARLAEAEGRSGPRDAEAEDFIRRSIAPQPGAPYYMAQTIIVQNQALEAAGKRIEQLERSGAENEGGLLSGLFGGRGRSSVPPSGRRYEPRPDEQRGGGFLAGAAQTAMGVAGGVLIGNMLTGALFGNSAEASESEGSDGGSDDAPDSGGDFDAGGDFGDF